MRPPIRSAFMFITDLLSARPGTGPLWVRRLVVLTFPVSVPLLFATVVVLLPFAMVEALAGGLVGMARDLWRN